MCLICKYRTVDVNVLKKAVIHLRALYGNRLLSRFTVCKRYFKVMFLSIVLIWIREQLLDNGRMRAVIDLKH